MNTGPIIRAFEAQAESTDEANRIYRAFDAKVDSVDQEEKSLVAKINTCSKDRYNTVIVPSGGYLEEYYRNRVVLWEHGKDTRRFTDPIGKNKWIRKGGSTPTKPTTELLAKTIFLDDDFSQQRWEWYRDGVLSAFSVSAIPQWETSGPPTSEELRTRPDWEGATNIFRSWKLIEYSGTAVPGNADTLVAGRAATLLGLVQRSLISLPDDTIRILETHVGDSTDRRIVAEGGKFFVYSEDGKKRLGGPYATKEEAEKRLKEVEYFKHEDKAAPTGPYVEPDGSAWAVRAADGKLIVGFPSEVLARLCVAEMGRETRVNVGDLMVRQHQESLSQFQEIRDDLRAILDLSFRGVV